MGRQTFFNSFPSPEMFLFCMDEIESIEWQDLEQRQRIGGCFEFTIFIENFVICCFQLTKIFCSR